MAECQALLNPKDSYSCRWGLGSAGASGRFHGDDWGDSSERNSTSVISSTHKLWQSTESSMYETEAEEKCGHLSDDGSKGERKMSVKHGKDFEGCSGSSQAHSSPVGSSDDFSIQHMQVEIQPFANEPINGPELVAAVMKVRCCGLLRWELDHEKPHDCVSLHFTVVVDKEIFDVHNLALEMDQALSKFATCSVAVKATGSQTHHYLVGGASKSIGEHRRQSDTEHVLRFPPTVPPTGAANTSSSINNNSSENKPSRLRRLLKSRSLLMSLFNRTTSANGSLSCGGKMTSASSTQSMDGLTSLLQEIVTELKITRKEIRDVQSHVYFLSRHISNLTLGRPKAFHESSSSHGMIELDPSRFPPRIFGLHEDKNDADSSSVSPSFPNELDVP